jgi:hypothetical protein
VTAEKATTHIIVKSMNSAPDRGRFIVSSNVSKKMKKKEEIFEFPNQNDKWNFNSVICYNLTDLSAGGVVCSF